MKTTYTATFPNGHKATRTTIRAYSTAWCVEATKAATGEKVYVTGFGVTPGHAHTAAENARNKFYRSNKIHGGDFIYVYLYLEAVK